MKYEKPSSDGALKGLRVLDLSHQYSGALAASFLADLGADVVCVEHPRKTAIRTMLPKKDGESLWWKVVQRGKSNITLDLSSLEGRDIFLSLVRDFDILIENFRPGTLERWRIGPKDLEAAEIDIVMLRISGFGQSGPMRDLPGFGTIAEAMSGFAHLNGFPDGPPVFPSSTLADGVAAIFGAFGIMAATVARLRQGSKGVEVVDMALFEGLFRLIPTQVAGYDQIGQIPERPGNFLSTHGVLRNLYKSGNGEHFVVSAVGAAAIRRVLVAADSDELVERIDNCIMDCPPAEVEAFLIDCNTVLIRWSQEHNFEDLSASLTAAGAVFSRVFDVSDIVGDPHYQAREDLIQVPDADFNMILMQGVVPKFPNRNHTVSHAGQARGYDNARIYGKTLGLGEEGLKRLVDAGVI